MAPVARLLNSCRPRCWTGAAAIAVALLAGGCLQDDVTPMPPRYRAAVEGVLARYHVSGALVSVSVPGEAAWKGAFGYANLEDRTPFDPVSYGSIRSVTKSYTVTVILQLVRDRVLRLDDKLDRFVPGIPNGDRITLADLAGMQSGIADYSAQPAFQEDFGSDFERAFSEEELVAYAIPASPVFEPGTQYEYSNTNTVLLGMVIEQVTRQPLGSVLQSRVFTPLGLTGTSYPLTVPLPLPHPTPYAVAVDDGAAEKLPLVSPTGLAGAGAMVSTLADLETWGKALGDGRLIGPELQKERIERSRPVTNGPEYDRYGLGIGILAGWWGHTGSGIGWQAATFYDPRSGTVIAAMVNETPVGGGRDLNIAQELFEALADVVATR
jgi:D-alanyl-D-alanine carboxypeptidase